MKINLANEKVFKVIAEINSQGNLYVQSAKLNGEPLSEAFFTHNDILNGGTLEFEMGATANKKLLK